MQQTKQRMCWYYPKFCKVIHFQFSPRHKINLSRRLGVIALHTPTKKRSEEIEKEGKKMVGQFFLIVQTFVELLVGEDGISQKFVLFANLSDMNSTQLSKKNCQNIETKLNFREEGLFFLVMTPKSLIISPKPSKCLKPTRKVSFLRE